MDSSNTQQSVWEREDESEDVTRFDGKFEYRLDNVDLHRGNYLVKVEPMSAKYDGLSAATELFVNEPGLSLDDAVEYIQLFVGVSGGIIGVSGFSSSAQISPRKKTEFSLSVGQFHDVNPLGVHDTYG